MGQKLYLTDITAAMREMLEMEWKLGSWESTNWTEREDHDEIGELDVVAPAMADQVVELLQGLAAGHHVDDVQADLHHQLLRHDDPEAQLLAEDVLAELVVAVEALPGHHLVHLHHLP